MNLQIRFIESDSSEPSWLTKSLALSITRGVRHDPTREATETRDHDQGRTLRRDHRSHTSATHAQGTSQGYRIELAGYDQWRGRTGRRAQCFRQRTRVTAMNQLADFPITKKWPPQHPDRIQLYSLNTPNGIKASTMLEETGLPYEAHLVTLDGQQRSPEFLSLNPYGKIPAIIDPQGPDGKPLPLFESGAILIYLADKSGQFLAPSGAERYLTLQWLMFQMAGI